MEQSDTTMDHENDFVAVCARMQDNALVAEECRSLTGSAPNADGIARCETVSAVPRAAYVRTGVRLLARGATLEDLVRGVADTDVAAEEFRIEFHASAEAILTSQRAATVALADAIPCYPNLDNPRHRFLVFARDDELWFGEILTECERTYRRHDDKPSRTSSSLSCRLSRALVNLVAPVQTLLDPCCGTGSILLEAQSLGIQASGADWNRQMVGMARENLAHFGYDAQVDHADARTYTRTADAIVTDLPYGRALATDEPVVRAILERGAELAPVAVYVAGDTVTDWLADAGYRDVAVYPVFKRTGFARYVHLARSEQSEPTLEKR